MDKPEKNQICRVRIEGYSSEGAGIARLDSFVIFVKGGIRGELCDVKILKAGKNAAFARMERVLEPSPERENPACPDFGRCGGCDFWHMSYEEERKAKRLRVEDALHRLAGQDFPVPPVLASKRLDGYRNKAIYPVACAAGKAVTGFFRARSHDVVPVSRCRIQHPEADAAAACVREWMDRYAVPPYEETTGKGLVRDIFVRFGERTREMQVCIVAAGETLPHSEQLIRMLQNACPGLAGVILSVNRRPGNVILGERMKVLWGREYIEDILMGLTFRLSPRSFYQVNTDQAERLYGIAADFAGLDKSKTVLDLYCGTGTITLVMARYAGRALGAEIVEPAVEDARENARRNGIENAEFFCGDAGNAALTLEREGLRPDVIVVDPPRKGLDGNVIEAMLRMAPERIVYISCDPATLARDVKLLTEGGYRLAEVQPVDMFPRTAHVETVARLEKVIKN